MQAKVGDKTITHLKLDDIPIVRLESEFLQVDVAPAVGGRIVNLVDKKSAQNLLWRNQQMPLQRLPSGSEYDPNFFGGVDELLPNDIPETINGIPCPDHGELWTTSLNARIEKEELVLSGHLPKFGLSYERRMSLDSQAPRLISKYRITNIESSPRNFLWKLHAALTIEPGDTVECPAKTAKVVDLAWSRYTTLEPFDWPNIEGKPANIIPAPDRTMDFFYLYNLTKGEVALHSAVRKLRFIYRFKPQIFPYVWLFASYGGFNGHYTAILEPCTTMPISVNEAASAKQCTGLEPGQTMGTAVTISIEPLSDRQENER